ncbi:MAG: hypothetical protein AAFQ09_07010 [Pseudomonadota bacterium]
MRKNHEKIWLVIVFALVAFLVAAVSLYVAVDLNRTLATSQIIPEDKLALMSIKQEITDRFIGIFLTVITVLGAIAAVLGVGLYTVLQKKIEADLEAVIRHKVGIAQAWSICATYNEAAFFQWRSYEKTLQVVLTSVANGDATLVSQDDINEALNSFSTARDMIKSGRDTISELSEDAFKEYVSEKSRLKAYVNLLNGGLYASTAQSILTMKAPSAEHLEELDGDARDLKEFALSRLISDDNYRWWESVETIGFFNYHIGRLTSDSARSDAGSRLLNALQNRDQFRSYLSEVPPEVSSQVEREYSNRGFSL